MAVMTITDERFQAVEEFASKVERTREEIVDEAIDRYLRLEEFERACAGMRAAVKEAGITEKDIEDAIREVREEDLNEVIKEGVEGMRYDSNYCGV